MGVCVCVCLQVCVCVLFMDTCVYIFMCTFTGVIVFVYVFTSMFMGMCAVCVSMCMFMGIYAAYNCPICISAESGMQIDLTTHPINTQATQFGPNNMVPYLTGIMYGIHRILKWVKIVSSI